MRPVLAGIGVLLAVMVVGAASAEAARATHELSSVDVREQETSLGDLVADAIQEAAKADATLATAAQFKSGTVAAGKVSTGDVTALLIKPDRKWVVSALTGKTLKQAFERSLSRLPDPSAHFLQVAGIRVEYDPNPNAPAGTRVKSLEIKQAPVQDAKVYRIAMPEDLAKGGSGYFTIAQFSEDTILDETTGTLAEAITDYLGANATLTYTNLNRIVAAGD